jgi:DNA-binding GntR family transcriptional regulator
MLIRPSKTIAEKVLRVLEEEILSGKYKPGDRLVEREIAEGLGVSRIPVREALQTLVRRGFVRTKGSNRKGREVVGISEKEIRENYFIRAMIEEYALWEKSLQKDKKLSSSLTDLIEQMEGFAKEGKLDNYRNLNSKFHHEIVRSLNNRKVYGIYDEASKSTGWFQKLTLYAPRMEDSIREHKDILKGYEEQDLLKIRRVMKAHYHQAVEFLIKKLGGKRDES